jgi:alpha-mannosidase
MEQRQTIKITFALALTLLYFHAGADPLTDRLDHLRDGLTQQFSVSLDQWRFHRPDDPSAEQPGFDDTSWSTVAPGFSWTGENTKVWFRTTAVIPATVAGQPVDGVPVRLDLGVDDGGELYVEGKLKEAFQWDDGRYTLTAQAQPGQTFHLAVRGINGPGNGQLHFARLYFNVLPEFDQYLEEVKCAALLSPHVPADQQSILKLAVDASERDIQFTNITPDNLASVRAQLVKAQSDLAPIAAVTRKYDVYYIGHAHIDMNWLWPWPETIDVCHRTWNSAMNLMDEFPDFHFVQSQPGAYAAIQTNYPDEFARMQSKAALGQWDTVGGLWNESDTDIPSGEGLARSFILGQQFFKTNFGKYAVTGWLPDSFGHSWQMPQIMQLVGIRNYYHMRCGNDMQLTWWESPDGSRVLKANTDNYDADVELDQLAGPAINNARFNLPQSVTVFGVGDHGGGPTREQIFRIKSFQDDPLLPHVHFASADTFFDQLSRQPAAASLPVVHTDLQYTLEGCYTTHADMKKAIRSSENNLYSAEILSSLAAILGQPYPLADFQAAWRPTAFAQFHDIACGSAIHSTYDWMHQQLAPAFQFEHDQTAKTLDYLTATIDTRGAGDQAIAVWNTLSFPRDDLVKVTIPDAAQYHSVTDRQGHTFPAQAMDAQTLAFVARQVPAFGYAVYSPETNTCDPDGIVFQDNGAGFELQTPSLDLQIDKSTGNFIRLYSRSAQWNVFGHASYANAFQLLGDSGNAWLFNYTGDNRFLTTQGASVSLLDQGPVFDRIRVTHALGQSTYIQDITVYGALPRIDIPTTVNWQEQHQTLKLRFPVNGQHLEAVVQIPYGNISRPETGQECPGQKWMDVSETTPHPVANATPVDLSAFFNSRRGDNFDGGGISYPAEELPAPGQYQLGFNRVPFNLPDGRSSLPDNIASSGQKINLPAHTDDADTLYLLAASVNGNRWTDIGFDLGDGKIESRAFDLNDWVIPAYPDNEAGLLIAHRRNAGSLDNYPCKMWIVPIPLPPTATALILPPDPNVHIFAATLATRPAPDALYGLSILNDSKYGCDFTNHVFRLTALRSSSDPDPKPDQGLQNFTYSLYPHAGTWQAAHTDEQALGLNIPLLAAVTRPHAPANPLPAIAVSNIGGQGDLIVTALKRAEDGNGYILRFYEAEGRDTRAQVGFDKMTGIEETDILERPLPRHPLTINGHTATLPIGHNQIITLRLLTDS